MVVSTNSPNPSRTKATGSSNAQNARQTRPRRVFTPISMTYTALFPHYYPNTKCDYHAGVVGHPRERCWALKHKVQDLIEGGWLNFKETGPSVNMNPLPPHGGPSVNTLSHEPIRQETLEQRMPQIAVIEQTKTSFLKLLTIYYDLLQTPLTISIPTQPTYRNNHAVPWRYDPVTVAASKMPREKSLVKEITNIVEVEVSLGVVAVIPRRSYEGGRLTPLEQRIRRLGTPRL
ncbi:hypothetical protein CR513_46552, partial [Mucuna pruriens]